ncbi:NO-binding membrane sensor protein with MHYT domain [Nonomuraea fuscirosea]|uniref:NO-binding membrane sensor protein with MHYT domain n=1 Tax=Nonomuraea fuscirosea TaxID=1291556 RepID=A0A2T0MUR8_9ACTN|nr:MHYT domain-containing protein [Nonomuraea fuscirosea]PRX62549.1 NO-binding membrane sensor protein with MHYT domain [Nonomuraea fuscirosea]
MSPVDHFSFGLLTPVLAYVMSSVGSMLGLLLTSRARLTGGREAKFWLAGAAFAIGGTGIWTMHFIAMLGFSVHGSVIRYDVPLTAASAILAVVVVGMGLFLASHGATRGGAGTGFLLGGGVLTGLGVAGMHYLGMAAMNMSGMVSYDPVIVTLSVLIAVAAATVALWFTLRVSGALRIGGAALVMGVAVSGMHYTGMYSMSVAAHTEMMPVAGAQAIDFLLPLIVGISLITVGLLLTVILSPSEKELRSEQEYRRRLRVRDDEGAPEVDLFGTPRA